MRSDCIAMRLRSRQVSCITGSCPNSYNTRQTGKDPARTIAAVLSVTLTPCTRPTSASSTERRVPNPLHASHMPRGLLNEKLCGESSGKLRPNMFTETVFTRKMARSLAIPVSSVLVTGKRNLVYVKADHENHFEAREVGLGTRFEGKYEILWGLQEGETVVSQGGYLIDSESQLRSGSGASHQHGETASPEPSKEATSQHVH